MTYFKGIKKTKAEQETNAKLELNLVNQYKNAVSGYFNTVSFEYDFDGNRNPFYCYDMISKFKEIIDDDLDENVKSIFLNDLKKFNNEIENILIDILRFFMAINKYDGKNKQINEDIILNYTSIENGLKTINQYDLIIKKELINGDSLIAIDVKNYCLFIIKKTIHFLDNRLFININKCPLKYNFKKIQKNLEHSTIRENVDFNKISNSNDNKNVKSSDPDFFDFIQNISNKTAFSNDLKQKFNNERSTEFGLLIYILTLEKIFLYYKFAPFFRSIKKNFNRDIGDQNKLNDTITCVSKGEKKYEIEIASIKNKLNPLINKYKI